MSSSEDEYRPGGRSKSTRKVKKPAKPAKAAKDPNKPKLPLSSYMRFVNDKRAGIKEENPNAGIGDIAKIAGKMWKEIDEDEKERYESEYRKEKEKYNRLMEDYVPAAGFKTTGKRPKKDPNAPKKPMTAYFAWMNENRPRIKEEHPNASLGEIAKVAGSEWKEVDPDVKAEFEEAYKKQMEAYKKQMKNYVPDKSFANGGKSSAKAKGKGKKKTPAKYESSDEEDGGSTSSLSEAESSSRKKARRNESESD